MDATTFFFVMLGIVALTANLMRLVLWLDTPRASARGRRVSPAPRTASFERSAGSRRCDRAAAELRLERAQLAA